MPDTVAEAEALLDWSLGERDCSGCGMTADLLAELVARVRAAETVVAAAVAYVRARDRLRCAAGESPLAAYDRLLAALLTAGAFADGEATDAGAGDGRVAGGGR